MLQRSWSEHLLCWMSWHQPGRCWQLNTSNVVYSTNFFPCSKPDLSYILYCIKFRDTSIRCSWTRNISCNIQGCWKFYEILLSSKRIALLILLQYTNTFSNPNTLTFYFQIHANHLHESNVKSWCALQQFFSSDHIQYFREHLQSVCKFDVFFVTLRWKHQTCLEKTRIALRLIFGNIAWS